MADINENGVLYNTGKAYKNGQEYMFDWTMLAEYNELVSDVADIQSDLKTSIENKGVTVPSDAPLSSYPGYIDQIDARGAWMTNVVTPGEYLYDQGTAITISPISWEYNGNAYGISDTSGGNSSAGKEGIMVCKMIPSTGVAGASLNWYQLSRSVGGRQPQAQSRKVYKNADSSSVYAFAFLYQGPSPSHPGTELGTYCYGFLWNTSTMTITGQDGGLGTLYDYDPTNYGFDLTNYTQVTGSSWAKNAEIYWQGGDKYYRFNIKD